MNTTSTKKARSNVAVIGGGAAGMFAACTLAERGADVTLFERNRELGLKLGITGKGRCNLTNNCDVKDFLSNVPVGQKFLYSALYTFTPQDTMKYFETLGVSLKTERGNRVFPVSDKARDIVFALKGRLLSLGVKTVNARITKLFTDENGIRGVYVNERPLIFDKVIVATGGKSYPKTGSTGDGYALAKSCGHTIKELYGSLVPLETVGSLAKELQGLSLKNVKLSIIENASGKTVYDDFGEMLFTHFGVSGPLVLSASSHLRKISEGQYDISIDLKPSLDEKALDKRILSDFEKYKNKDLVNGLSDLLPIKMIRPFIQLCELSERTKINSIDRESRKKMVASLKAFRLTVKSRRDISEAIITSGGVSTSEIDPKTMQSKLCKGLYFAGEVLDVDAYTGGFNLQIAFSTAYLAALDCTKGEENE